MASHSWLSSFSFKCRSVDLPRARRSPRSARLAARARVSGALASQNAPRCIVASSCCNTPGYIVYIECTQAGGRANLEQPTRPSEYMHACNFLLVRIFETNFLLNRNPERQIVCCIRFKKNILSKIRSNMDIFFIL